MHDFDIMDGILSIFMDLDFVNKAFMNKKGFVGMQFE